MNRCLQFLEVEARFWNCYKNVNNIWVLFDNSGSMGYFG